MRRRIIILMLGVLLSCGGLVQAEPITIQITGNVTSVGGYTQAIPDTIHADVTFTGTYTYDSLTDDSGGGHYVHDAPYGITLSLGGYEFKTAPNHVGQFDMRIGNDQVGNGIYDIYSVNSYQNVSIPSVDFAYSIEWKLMDYTHAAFSSGDLPVAAPVLTDWDYNIFKIHGVYGPDLTGLTIYGTVTQVVPEPVTGILMAIGVFLLRRRR